MQKIRKCTDGNYSTGRARPLISHIPSKATTFEDYHRCIPTHYYFCGSVRTQCRKWRDLNRDYYFTRVPTLAERKQVTHIASKFELAVHVFIFVNRLLYSDFGAPNLHDGI